ncbi:MAG: TspO protein [Pseudarthrobacter sp.]|nr:TspO protein [Pseudarthrobacter sp.]
MPPSQFDERAPGVHSGSVSTNAEEVLPRPALAGNRVRRESAALVGFLAVSWLVSLLGSLPIRMNGTWYALADKAPWTPPGWVFSSVWLVLYAAMAVAAWMVWRHRQFPRGTGFRGAGSMAYGGLLLLNLAWPLTFFGMYPMIGAAALWLALVVLAAHAAVAAYTVLRFGPISRTAGLLMLPYVSWLVFSASLNLYAALKN